MHPCFRATASVLLNSCFVATVRMRYMLFAATLALLDAILVSERGRAYMVEDGSGDPWDRCTGCHGLDG